MANKSTKTTKKSSRTTSTKPRTTKSESVKKETKKIEKTGDLTKTLEKTKEKVEEKTQDLSNTFINDVDQKSAIASLEDQIVEEREYRDEVETKTEKKAFRTFLIIVLCLVIGAVASYCYFEVICKDKDTKVVVKYKTKAAKFGYDKDSIGLKYLVDDYDYVGNFQVNIYNYLYSADEINVKDMEQDYLKLLAIKKADSDKDGVISSIEFNDAVEYLFGGEVQFNNDAIKTDDILCAKYSYENGEYKQEEKTCEGTSELRLQRKILDVKEAKNSMEVTVAIAILDNENDKVGKSLTFDENGGQTLGDELEGVTAKNFVIDTATEELTKFVYYFKYNDDNNNYYLESIKLDN